MARLASLKHRSYRALYCTLDSYSNDTNLLSLKHILSVPTFRSQIPKKQENVPWRIFAEFLKFLHKCKWMYTSYNFNFWFTWSCPPIPMSSNTKIKDFLKLKFQHVLTFSPRYFRALRRKKSFWMIEGEIKFLNLRFLLNTKRQTRDTTTKFLISKKMLGWSCLIVFFRKFLV